MNTNAATSSLANREALAHATRAGCYCCCRIFAADTVTEWTDGGTTALCPRCGVDAVIAETGPPLTQAHLVSLWTEWFDPGPDFTRLDGSPIRPAGLDDPDPPARHAAEDPHPDGIPDPTSPTTPS